MTGARLNSRRSIAIDTLPSRGSDGPAPGILDTLMAAGRVEDDDLSTTQDLRIIDAYKGLSEALIEAGEKPDGWKVGIAESLVNTGERVDGLYDRDALWEAVQWMRKQRPGAFKDLPSDRATFEQNVLNRGGASQEDAYTASRGPGWAAFIGGTAVGLKDPWNLVTTIFGGGAKTIGSAILREAVVNTAFEAAQQPVVARNRARRGEELTGQEAAINIAGAAVVGGVLGGAGKYVGDNWGAIKALPKAAQQRAWQKIAPHLPEKLRGTMDWDAVTDDVLPDLAEGLIGRGNLTPDETTAIDTSRVHAGVRSASPFTDDPAGDMAHLEELGDMMRRIIADAGGSDAPPPRAVRPAAVMQPSAGAATGSGRAVLKRNIGITESNLNPRAKNPNSSAYGTYQFTTPTWLTFWKRRYGTKGMSDAQIAAKRSDPRYQEILMDDLIDYNTRVLARAGFNDSAGNLYLAHFAGAETAAKLLRADRNAPAASIFSPDAINANGSILRGKTVGQVIDWAHRKMGSTPAPGTARAAGDSGDPVAAIDSQLADIDRQLAELDAADGAQPSAIDAAPLVDVDAIMPEPLDFSASIPMPRVPLEEAERAAGLSLVTARYATPEDVRAALEPTAPVELFEAVVAPRQQVLAMAESAEPQAQAVMRAVLGKERADALAQVAERVRGADADALPARLAEVTPADVAAIGQWEARFRQGMEIMQMREAGAVDARMAEALPMAEARWADATGIDLPDDLRGDMPDALRSFMLREQVATPAASRAAAQQTGGGARAGDDYGATETPGPMAETVAREFDEADGPGSEVVSDSLDHDMRAVLAREDEARPLFNPDDMFRLDTGDEPRPVADVLEAIDDEQAAIETIRGCL
jgi:hypothetical protein